MKIIGVSKKTLVFIKLFIAVGLLWFLFTLVDFRQFWINVKNAKKVFLVAAMLLYFPANYILVLRWDSILRYYKIIFPKRQLFTLYLVSGFLSNFMPTSVGGDVYKFVCMKKERPQFDKEILSSIIIERGIGFLSLFLINIILFFLFAKFTIYTSSFFAVEILIILAFLFIVCIIFFKDKVFFFIDNHNNNNRLFAKFKRFLKVLTSFKKQQSIFLMFMHSFFFMLMGSLSLFLVFYSLGHCINIFYILLVFTIVNIFQVLPISLNSIGIYEGLSVYLFGIYGIGLEISLAATIMGRILLMLVSSSGGVLYISKIISKKFK
ncbi:MAG: lysylphosphatidylglycerol synthase transmembrane domain-containing protein [Candidatus Omnitrophota bacterium]